MPSFLPNEPVAQNRNAEVALFQDDDVTKAVNTTVYTGVKAKRKLGGLTATLSSAILNYISVGVAGNAISLALTADGSGVGNLTGGPAYVFHYQNGVTTVNNLISAVAAVFTLTGTFTGTNTLAAGDATAALKLAGGRDASLYVRQGSSVNYAAALGTFTNVTVASVARDGQWVYQFTQGELNFTNGSEVGFLVSKVPEEATITLATTHLDGIYYDKTAVGSSYLANPNGALTQLQLVADGAGAGSLSEGAYPLIVFHYATGVTTVKNFEDAIVASTNLAVKQYATNWTSALTSPGDTIGATTFISGITYSDRVCTWPMRKGDMDCTGEGTSYAYGDLLRLIAALNGGVSADFRTGTLTFKSIDGTKVRVTITTDVTGRLTETIGDLTP